MTAAATLNLQRDDDIAAGIGAQELASLADRLHRQAEDSHNVEFRAAMRRRITQLRRAARMLDGIADTAERVL